MPVVSTYETIKLGLVKLHGIFIYQSELVKKTDLSSKLDSESHTTHVFSVRSVISLVHLL